MHRPALVVAAVGAALVMSGCGSVQTPEAPQLLLTQQQRGTTGPLPALAGVPAPGWTSASAVPRQPSDGAPAAEGVTTLYAAPGGCVVEVATMLARADGKDFSWGRGDDRQLSDKFAKTALGKGSKGTRIEGLDSDIAVSEVTVKGDKGKVSAREGSAKVTGYEVRTLTRLSETSGQGFFVKYLCQGRVDYATWTAIKDGITVVGFVNGDF